MTDARRPRPLTSRHAERAPWILRARAGTSEKAGGSRETCPVGLEPEVSGQQADYACRRRRSAACTTRHQAGVSVPTETPGLAHREGSQPQHVSTNKHIRAQAWVPKTIFQERGPGLPVDVPESRTGQGKFKVSVDPRKSGSTGSRTGVSRRRRRQAQEFPKAEVGAGRATQAETVPPKARSLEAQPRVPVIHHGKWVGERTALPYEPQAGAEERTQETAASGEPHGKHCCRRDTRAAQTPVGRRPRTNEARGRTSENQGGRVVPNLPPHTSPSRGSSNPTAGGPRQIPPSPEPDAAAGACHNHVIRLTWDAVGGNVTSVLFLTRTCDSIRSGDNTMKPCQGHPTEYLPGVQQQQPGHGE